MNSTDEPVIAASGLSKSFCGNPAVNNLDLAVPRGSMSNMSECQSPTDSIETEWSP